MTETVIVVVGEWECSEQGNWNFVVEKDVMAHCLVLERDVSYVELRTHIENELDVRGSGLQANITFWVPAEMSVVSSSKSPPIAIKSEMGLRSFKKFREKEPRLNLCVSFGSPAKLDLNHSPKVRVGGSTSSPCGRSNDNWFPEAIRLRDETPSSAQDIPATQPLVRKSCFLSASNAGPPYFDNELAAHVRALEAFQNNGGNEDQRNGKQVAVESSKNADTGEHRKRKEVLQGPLYFDDALAAHVRAVEALDNNGENEEQRNGTQVDAESRTNAETSQQGKGKDVVIDIESEEGEGENSADSADKEASDYSCSDDYDFDFWDELIEDENSGNWNVNFDHQVEMADAGDSIQMFDVPLTQPSARAQEEVNGSQSATDNAEGLNVQSTLAHMYEEVRQGTLLPSRDAPALFEDGFVMTGEMAAVDYDDADDAIYIGRVFANKKEMQTILAIHAIKRMFTFKQDKSDTERVILSCVDPNCRWRVFGKVISKYSHNIKIRTCRLKHTCDVSTRAQYGKNASAKVIGEVLKAKFLNGNKGPRACEIPQIVLAELKVSVNYMKAWYAREAALATSRGTDEANFKLLRGYMKLLSKANPGTVYEIKTARAKTGELRFKYLFFAMGASISAIPYLRKVVVIDGTTIKAKFKGCLMTASFQDGNYQIFPLGFGVVDGETDAAWTWFLTQLKTILPDDRNLMFVSDRNSSIYTGIEAVYPLAQHGACSVHLYRNIKNKFRGEGLGYVFSRAARAYNVGEFNKWFSEIEKRNEACAEYLRSIGVEHWSQCYSIGRRYNISSSNVAESLNSALAKALEFPIVSMVETIRMLLMQWFCWRRDKAAKATTVLTPEVENMLLREMQESGGHEIVGASCFIFQVNTPEGKTFTVDLAKRRCSCRKYDILSTPCSHAIAAGRACGMPIPEMAEIMFTVKNWKQVYAGIIVPVLDKEDVELESES